MSFLIYSDQSYVVGDGNPGKGNRLDSDDEYITMAGLWVQE